MGRGRGLCGGSIRRPWPCLLAMRSGRPSRRHCFGGRRCRPGESLQASATELEEGGHREVHQRDRPAAAQTSSVESPGSAAGSGCDAAAADPNSQDPQPLIGGRLSARLRVRTCLWAPRPRGRAQAGGGRWAVLEGGRRGDAGAGRQGCWFIAVSEPNTVAESREAWWRRGGAEQCAVVTEVGWGTAVRSGSLQREEDGFSPSSCC